MTDLDRWRAVLRRDPTHDDGFFFGVTTTGIFCRPSCPARRPKRAHVQFFDTTARALEAGFRACKRCRPLDAAASATWRATVTRLCRRLEGDEVPTLQALADDAGLSPFHLQRRFKATVGVTPRQYARAARAARARALLRSRRTVTEALYDAGYSSPSRFYAELPPGLTPSKRAERVEFATAPCALGRVLVGWTTKGVCAVHLGASDAELERCLRADFPHVSRSSKRARLVRTIGKHLDEPALAIALPLDIRGTAFQRRVWDAVARIPAGHTATYAALARVIGQPAATRAVASAVAANRLAVLVPCHRVVRADGQGSGYRWGLGRKHALLAAEAARPAPSVRQRASS